MDNEVTSMTGKYYGIYVIYQDGTKELLGSKMRLNDLDHFTMQSQDYPSFVFDMKLAYPHITMKKIKEVRIEYQARGKTRQLPLVFKEDRSFLDIEYVYHAALANFDHPTFFAKVVEPHNDGKNYPLAQLCHSLVLSRNHQMVSSDEYCLYYNAKIRFLRMYLFKDKTGELNYLHFRRIYGILQMIHEKKAKTLYEVSTVPREEVACEEVDEELRGLLQDDYLSKEEKAYAEEQYEQLPVHTKHLYHSDI